MVAGFPDNQQRTAFLESQLAFPEISSWKFKNSKKGSASENILKTIFAPHQILLYGSYQQAGIDLRRIYHP